jgi:hypothetical protein
MTTIRGDLVFKAHGTLPDIKSHVESSMEYFISKPTTTFQLKHSDDFIRWNTNWGSNPSSCKLAETIGEKQSRLHNFDPSTNWSPNCWSLNCPLPGMQEGHFLQPWQPNQK